MSDHRIYSGEYRHTMDEKHRITVPAVWRRALEGEEFFTVPQQNLQCLVVLPPVELDKVSELVKSAAGVDAAQQRAFIRQFYSRARQCVTDRQGRILIPEDHCRQVGLEGDVVLVGSHARFEIWSPERWVNQSATEVETYRKVADLVGL